MYIKLVIHKEIILNLNDTKNEDTAKYLLERYNDEGSSDEQITTLDDADPDALHDTIYAGLADDINEIVDPDLDETDFEITVLGYGAKGVMP